MKNIKFQFTLIITLLLALPLLAQLPTGPTSICIGASGTCEVEGADQFRWVLKDINGVDISGPDNASNSNVRLFRGTSNTQIEWGTIQPDASKVTVRVAPSQTASNFKITCERFRNRWIGSPRNLGLGGSWDIGVPTIVPVIQTPSVSDVSSNCQNITFRILQPHQENRGVTYQWRANLGGVKTPINNASGAQVTLNFGAFVAQGFDSPFVLDVLASSNCTNSIASQPITLNFGATTAQLSTPTQNICLTEGGFSVTATSNQCITSVAWDFDPNQVTLQFESNNGAGSRTAFFSINSNVQSSTSLLIGALVNTFFGNTQASPVSIFVDGDPSCGPLFTGNTGSAEALKVNKKVVNSRLVKIYPNPATNSLTLEAVEETKTVQIYNMVGQLILQQQVDKEQTMLQLNVSALQTGTYIVCLVKNNGQLDTKKVLIER